MTVAELPISERQLRINAVGFDLASEPKERVGFCPLCESTRLRDLAPHDRFGFLVHPNLCVDCGFVFLGYRMTAEGYGEFYRRWYRPLVDAFMGEPSSDDGSHYASMVAEFAAQYAKQPYRRTALDVGGSTGTFSDELKKRWGYACAVVDPSPEELRQAAAKGHNVHCAIAEEFDAAGSTYDLVAMLQTVDHLLDPVGVLWKVRELLSPHGMLVIDFVDFRRMYTSFGLKSALKVDHPMYFTAYTAALLLARTGFEPIHQGLTGDRRHMLFVCRPVPPLLNYLPIQESVEQAMTELLAP